MDKALEGFLAAEAEDYRTAPDKLPFMTQVIEVINAHSGNVTLTSVGNFGNIMRQLTLYCYKEGKPKTKLEVNFCPCGRNCWLVSEKGPTMLGERCSMLSPEEEEEE